jgi:RNA polymerase sigma-70 factor (ECF subfamily)
MAPVNIREELEHYHSASYGWALACCAHDRSLADDVLQTVYVKVLEGRALYRGQSAFKTWLFAVIRKTAAGAWRRHLFRARHLAPEADAAQGVADESSEEAFERAEQVAQLREALAALPDRQRQVLHLVFYEEMSLREASAVMGVSIGTVRVHYERGKKRLRQRLDAREVSDGSRSHRGTIQNVVS